MLLNDDEAEQLNESLKNIFEESERKTLTEKQQNESRRLNQAFQTKKNSAENTKVWKMIQCFYSEEGSFKFKELETSVKDQVRLNHSLPDDAPEAEKIKREKKVEKIVTEKLKLGKVYTKGIEDRRK